MTILNKMLGFDPRTMKAGTEIMAGATTFFTMCYILAVNPFILSKTGMDQAALFTATALGSAIATILLALMARLPFAQAPSMGLNAFFAFTICGAMGYSWQQALAISLVEGVIFILITVIKLRIAFIGLKNANIIVSNPETFVSLGAFTHVSVLGIIGILLSGILMARNVKGALFISIIITTLIGIPMGVTVIPDHWIPVSMPQSLDPIFMQFDFSGLLNYKTAIVIISLLLVNIFDTIGTLVGLAYKAGVVRPDGSIPRVNQAMLSDAIGTTCGACLGTSTLTTYVESATGIAAGGRSGMTSLTVGILFLLSLFLSPIFLLIPGVATSGALVMVGVLMLDSVKLLDIKNVSDAFPAFITMITMVLCYSIADGIFLGILSYVIIKCFTGQLKDLNATLIILSVIFILKFIFG